VRTPLARTLHSRLVVAAALVLVTALLLPSVALAADSGGCNGTYSVQVYADGAWSPVGSLAFGTRYSSLSLALPEKTDRVRLVQSGGTAAQLDTVALDGAAPLAADGSSDALVVRKLASADNDVTQAFGTAVVLTFAEPGSVLEVRARVQGDLAGFFPFEYPLQNLCKPVTDSSAFYAYRPGTRDAIDQAAEPFAREFTTPSTGHPDGYTYVWVANDDEALLVTLDFTSDNTMDGDEDYATVHVKTADGVKSFTVTAGDDTWGEVAFTYTDKVAYQHKLYTFEIPWSEVGDPKDAVELAFTAYGTSAYTPIAVPVHRFYRAANQAHFYTTDPIEKANIEAHPAWGYTYDGLAYVMDAGHPWMENPLHRYYNAATRTHFFTADAAEKALVDAHPEWGYAYEGVAYEVSDEPALMPVYRFRNKCNGVHFYTGSEAEKNAITTNLGLTYELEGISFYIQPIIDVG